MLFDFTTGGLALAFALLGLEVLALINRVHRLQLRCNLLEAAVGLKPADELEASIVRILRSSAGGGALRQINELESVSSRAVL